MRFNDVTAAQAASGGGPSSVSGACSRCWATWTALGQKGFQGNVQDLAEALKTALQAGNDKGVDLSPALAKAINDALDQSQQTLTQQGVSASKAASRDWTGPWSQRHGARAAKSGPRSLTPGAVSD